MSCTAGHLANCNLPPDPMRRLNPGSANGRPRSIARNLFGHVDHDETQRTLERELRRIHEDDKHKWNFDFHAERPLSGRYQWQAVGPRSAESGNGSSVRASDSPPRADDDDDDDECPALTSAHGGTGHSRISVPTAIVASAATLVLPTRELSLASPARRTSAEAARVEPVEAVAVAARSTRQTTMKDYWPDKKPESGTKRPASTEASTVTNKMAAANEIPAKKSKKEPQL